MYALELGKNPGSARARNRRATPAELRERILNAAETCFERQGLTGTTVDDIVVSADISRATFYRLFSGREEIVLAALLRELDRISGRLVAGISKFETVEDVITEGIVLVVRTVKRNRKLSVLFGPDGAVITGRIAGSSEALLVRAHALGRILLDELKPSDRRRIREDLTVDDIADHLVRVILSLIVFPAPDLTTEAAQRRYTRTFVVPALLRSDP